MTDAPIGQIYNDIDNIHDRSLMMISGCKGILEVISGDYRLEEKNTKTFLAHCGV